MFRTAEDEGGDTISKSKQSGLDGRHRDVDGPDILEASRWDGTTALMRHAYDAFLVFLSEQRVA